MVFGSKVSRVTTGHSVSLLSWTKSDIGACLYSSPSPLDAIIASHVYPLMNLPETLELRRTIDAQLELKAYVERIMEVAAKNVRGHVRR